MGKRTRPSNGGEVASRGFIFQAVVALIECLNPDNDWDQIKNEPNAKEDKVDIMLYKGGKPKSAIQVKSSINAFERADVTKWLEDLKGDAKEAENVCLYLVGNTFTPSCEKFIKDNPNEIKKVPFEHLQRISTGILVDYIKRAGLGRNVRVDDLELIDASLFSEILRNSIARDPVSRGDFEAIFQKAIPHGEELEERIIKAVSGLVHKEHVIPQCLTPIPLIDKKTGLVGRDDIVKEIRKMLDENSCIVLVNGLGGIGKTAVMQGICNDLKDEGYYVAWISCGDSLQDDLLMLREALGVPKEEKADTAYSLVKAGIQKLGKNLYLFMDDLSRDVTRKERDEINALGVHVMITSRAENLPFHKMKLEYLDEENAIKMFYGYYGRDPGNERIVKEIIRSVGCHTLLLELLANAAKEEGGTLDEFYEKLQEDGFFNVSEEELDAEHDDENLTIEESVIRLYKISGLSEEQKRIMKLFTVFSPEKEIYHKIREWAGFDRKEMKKLVDLGWLERGGLENGYYIHQIVKDSIARQMEKNGEKVNLEEYGDFLAKVIDADSYLGREITYEKVRERLVLIEDVARFFIKNSREDADAGALFNSIGEVYHAQGNYDRALEFFEKARVIREKVLGMNHPDTATTYNNIANVYHALGEYEKALGFFEKARLIQENVLGMDHPDTATTYNNMAGVYKDLGDYEKALEFFEKARVIRENVLGMDHPSTAATYNNMAGVYKDLGGYEKALEFFEKAWVIQENVLGMDHPSTAATYNNMAGVYQDLGDFEKALKFLKKAQVIREKALGMDHPDTADTYNNMASVYKDLGDFEKALEFFEKARVIQENVLGMNHPYTATTYNNMAGVYQVLGDFEKALEFFEKARVIQENVLGMNHPDTAATYNNMAGVYQDLGDFEKALEFFEKARVICENALGIDHPSTATTYNNMASVYKDLGDFEKALEFFEKARVIQENVLGMNHPYTATTYNNMAGVYQVLGDFEKALEFFEKARVIQENVLGMNHPDTAATYNNMAGVYQVLGDFEKALEFFEKARVICENALGIDHPSTATTNNNMAGVYQVLGDFEKALEFFEKARVIQENVLGMEHPSTAATYNNMAWLYRMHGDYTNALEYYKKANQVFLSLFGEDHPHTQDTALSILIMELLLIPGKSEDKLKEMLKSKPSE